MFSIAAILLLLSLSTRFYTPVYGEVLDTRTTLSKNGSMNLAPNWYGGRYGGNIAISEVKYRYEVEGVVYESMRMCICVPFGRSTYRPKSRIKVYYIKFMPSFSVVERGPHLFGSGVFVLFGVCAYFIRRKLIQLMAT